MKFETKIFEEPLCGIWQTNINTPILASDFSRPVRCRRLLKVADAVIGSSEDH